MIVKARYITFLEGYHREGHWICKPNSLECEINTENGKIKKQCSGRGIWFEILSADDHYLRAGKDGLIEIYRKEDI